MHITGVMFFPLTGTALKHATEFIISSDTRKPGHE